MFPDYAAVVGDLGDEIIVVHRGARLEDFIQVPPPQAYFEPVNWHRTALQALGHWSGAEGR